MEPSRQSPKEPAPNHYWAPEFDALFDEAVERFGVWCLWSLPRVRSLEALQVISEKLRENGNMSAWRLAERIKAALAFEARNAGFTVDASSPYRALVEAKIGLPENEFTLVHWVKSGAWNFFDPVPDSEFGWRLHMADLSVNKALAAGGRRQIRDYVDLMLVHEHIMPLWHAIWASPGKDEGWSPLSLAEKIAASNGFKQSEVDNSVASIIPISASELSKTIKAAVEECREVFPNLPGHLAGRLFVDANGGLINDWKMIAADPGSIATLEAREGGTWPSGPSIDAILIERVASAYAASRPKYRSFDLGIG